MNANDRPDLGREGMVIVVGLSALGVALVMLAICVLVSWL